MSKSTRSSRRQAAKQEAATSAPVSYHPAATPIDARSLSVTVLFSTLDDRRKNRDLLACLDFVLLPDDKLLHLFYKEDQHYNRTWDTETGGLLLPPLAMCRTAQRIGEFFNMGIKDKKHQIAKFGDYTRLIHLTKLNTFRARLPIQRLLPNPTANAKLQLLPNLKQCLLLRAIIVSPRLMIASRPLVIVSRRPMMCLKLSWDVAVESHYNMCGR